MCPCVLARWTHQKGGDSNPSFGISVHDESTSIFHCFTCHEKGPLTYLLERLESFTGEDLSGLREQFAVGEEFGPPLREWQGRGRESAESIGPPLTSEYLDLYEWPGDFEVAKTYLKGRGITAQTCKRLQIQFDPDEERILFPVFDTSGALYGYSGRAVERGVEPRIKDYHGLPKRGLLLGAHLVGEADKVLVCEGLFDYAWLQQMGFPAVALLGTELTPEKATILKSLRKPVYCFTDCDEPGFDAAESIAAQLIAHVPVFEVEYPVECKIGDDPAVLSQADVEMMIADAELFRV